LLKKSKVEKDLAGAKRKSLPTSGITIMENDCYIIETSERGNRNVAWASAKMEAKNVVRFSKISKMLHFVKENHTLIARICRVAKEYWKTNAAELHRTLDFE